MRTSKTLDPEHVDVQAVEQSPERVLLHPPVHAEEHTENQVPSQQPRQPTHHAVEQVVELIASHNLP